MTHRKRLTTEGITGLGEARTYGRGIKGEYLPHEPSILPIQIHNHPPRNLQMNNPKSPILHHRHLHLSRLPNNSLPLQHRPNQPLKWHHNIQIETRATQKRQHHPRHKNQISPFHKPDRRLSQGRADLRRMEDQVRELVGEEFGE